MEKSISVRETRGLVGSHMRAEQGPAPQPRHEPWPTGIGINRQPFLCWDVAAQPTESCGSVLKLHFYQEPIRI